MRRQSFHAERMTKAQNRLAFTMWKNSCTDEALAKVTPASIARSYGLDVEFVSAEIARETRDRARAAQSAVRT
jgi:hypothetical protein